MKYKNKSLLNITQEASCYHSEQRKGFFSILVDKGDKYKSNIVQCTYKLSDMSLVLNNLDKTKDSWISQAEFYKPSRRLVYLRYIALLFVDLDIYKISEFSNFDEKKIYSLVLKECEKKLLPLPSIIVFSGRGVQIKWFLNSVLPSCALPRWDACQRVLINSLKNLGADPVARDASRVLRLIDTVNNKSSRICKVLYVNYDENKEPLRYSFDYIAEKLLPFSRKSIEEEKKAKKSKKVLKVIDGDNLNKSRSLNGRVLAWNRLHDLRTLVKLRKGVVIGERMCHLFWRLNFLLLSGVTNYKNFYSEAKELAKELDPNWNYNSKELMTLYEKSKQYSSGKKIEFKGKSFPPLYTPSNETLINIFQISSEEQKYLKTIISKDEKRIRDKEWQEKARRKKNIPTKEEYLKLKNNIKLEKIKQVKEMINLGLKKTEIAKKLDISYRTVFYYAKA